MLDDTLYDRKTKALATLPRTSEESLEMAGVNTWRKTGASIRYRKPATPENYTDLTLVRVLAGIPHEIPDNTACQFRIGMQP